MSNPKRYGFPDCECDATDEFYMEDKGMCELLDGGFVKWEDYVALKAEVETIQKEFKRSLENMDWRPISTYRGGNWAYLFVPLDNIPGNYIIVEGCFMVGLKKWWVRSWQGTDQDAYIKPTHWMPLFVPPEVGD